MNRKLAIAISAAAALAACVSEQTYKTEVTKADASATQAAAYRSLNTQLQAEIKANQVQIHQLQDRLRITMVDEILFPEGGWQLGRKGEETLAKMVPTLSGLKNQSIVVEGFTDNVPIGPELKKRFPSNWELSTARATERLSGSWPPRAYPRTRCRPKASVTPALSRRTTRRQGRAKKRRVDIVITGQNQ